MLDNRRFDLSSPVTIRARKYILDAFLPSYKEYDVVVGYRADDSYFSFTRAFLANTITLEQLKRAMHLGQLGEQTFIQGKKAFEAVSFVQAMPVDSSQYHPRYLARDRQAREDYRRILEEEPSESEVYVSTIIREKWTHGDPRL